MASLPRSQPRITGPPRPRGDDIVAVWIYGTWPDGTVEDRLISAGKVGTGDFSFATYLPSAP